MPLKGQHAQYEAVVIGGSAGSIDAVRTILSHLPKYFQASFIIVLHRKHDVKGNLSNIFAAKRYPNTVCKEADDKEDIHPGSIYIASANYHLLIEDNKSFTLDYSEQVNYSRPSIDVTFESAAAVYKAKMIAIILSGANDDGRIGLQLAQKAQALTIVQDPADAHYKTMPEAVLKKLTPDHVLSAHKIGLLLAELLK